MDQKVQISEDYSKIKQKKCQQSQSVDLPQTTRKLSYCNNDLDRESSMSYSTDFAQKLKANNRYFRKRVPDDCKNDLVELLQMIYTEDIFYSDLQEYFAFCFSGIDNFGSFHLILYNSISSYLQQIKSNIHELLKEVFDSELAKKSQNYETHQYFAKGIYKNFSKFSKKYSQIILSLADFYDLVDSKGQVIQKIANHFMSHYHKHMVDVFLIQHSQNKIFQHIDCRELHKTLYTETILKDDAIKILLDNLSILFQENKFYAQHYKQIVNKVDKLNQQRFTKHGPSITQTTIDINSNYKFNQIQQNALNRLKPQFRFQIKIKNKQDDSYDNSIIMNKSSLNNSDKKKKCLQKPMKMKRKKQESEQLMKFDEVKEFERQIELDFEQYKDTEKISINITKNWIQKIKQKFIQTLRIL